MGFWKEMGVKALEKGKGFLEVASKPQKLPNTQRKL